MIKFNLICEYKLPFNPNKTIKKITKQISRIEKIKKKHIISIILVNDQRIQAINNEFRHINKPTDVISFAHIDDAIDQQLPYELGDIFISVDRVYEQAKDYQHSILREFAFLVVHGVLHLLGYDHINKEDEIIMFKKQQQILYKLKITRNEGSNK